MSDRSSLAIFCTPESEDRILAGLGATEPEERYQLEDGLIQIVFTEMPGGGQFEMEALAREERSLSFWAYHAGHYTYDQELTVSHGGEVASCLTDLDGCPVIRVLEDGSLSADDLEEARLARRLIDEISQEAKQTLARPTETTR